MGERQNEQLLGYILDALEPDEKSQIEQQLQHDPSLQAELHKLQCAVQPILDARPRMVVPGNLAERTCLFVDTMTSGPVGSRQVTTPSSLNINEPTDHDSTSADHSTVSSAASAVPPKSRVFEQSLDTRPRDNRPQPADRANHFRSLRGDTRPLGRSNAWRMADLFTVTGVTMMSMMLVFPAVNSSRFNSRVQQCQENMRQVGQQLHGYSELNRGFFPQIPESGELSTAGVYAPILRDAGLLENDRAVICPDSSLAQQQSQNQQASGAFEVPSYAKLNKMPPQSPELADIRQRMGGSYAYNLGYTDGKTYHNSENLRRSNYPILADAPTQNAPQLIKTLHHGGRGQNVLFEDGHVQFVSSQTYPTGNQHPDHLYLNDNGVIAAGTHAGDAVLGSSGQSPLHWTSNRR